MAITTQRQNQQAPPRNDLNTDRRQSTNPDSNGQNNNSGQNQNGGQNSGPVETFRLNNVSISIFENESERDGHKNRYHRAKIDKRYHDQKSGEWKSTTSFSLEELLRLRFLIDNAVEFMATKPGE